MTQIKESQEQRLAFVCKYTDAGTVAWLKRFGDGPENFVSSVAAARDGSVYAVPFAKYTEYTYVVIN